MEKKGRSSILGKLLILLVAVGIGAGGVHWLHSQSQLLKLQKDLEVQKKLLKEAIQHIENLLGEKRVAEVVVREQTFGEDGVPVSKIRFLQYGSQGQELTPTREFTVKGAEVYFDAVVIMFKPEEVMEGRAASIQLFRRVFTDKTQPEKGYSLWEMEGDEIPESYRAPGIPLDVQKKAWGEIKRILVDESYRNHIGVRTIFGQAVSKKLQRGRIYTLNIQNNGGLLVEDKPIPPILKD